MRKKWRSIAIWVAVVLFGLLVMGRDNSIGTSLTSRFGDAMDWKSRWLAGSHSVNCGRVEVNGDPTAATECALRAQAEGRPFRVAYNIMGIDSHLAQGILRTPSGDLYALTFEGVSLFRQGVRKSACPKPTHLWVTPQGKINCFQPQLSPPLEPYVTLMRWGMLDSPIVRRVASVTSLLAVPVLIVLACRAWLSRDRAALPYWRNGIGLTATSLLALAWLWSVGLASLSPLLGETYPDLTVLAVICTYLATALATAWTGRSRWEVLAACILMGVGWHFFAYA